MRDYEKQPVKAEEAIQMFLDEDFDLVFASQETVEEAARIGEERGDLRIEDIFARWDDLQEELRCMAQEFM